MKKEKKTSFECRICGEVYPTRKERNDCLRKGEFKQEEYINGMMYRMLSWSGGKVMGFCFLFFSNVLNKHNGELTFCELKHSNAIDDFEFITREVSGRNNPEGGFKYEVCSEGDLKNDRFKALIEKCYSTGERPKFLYGGKVVVVSDIIGNKEDGDGN